MLFIIAISSIGMPLITHSCSHDNQKDLHLFSSEHHCDDDCKAPDELSSSLSFNEVPCCSFETNFLKSDQLFSSQKQISTKQILVLSISILAQEKLKKTSFSKLNYNSFSHKLFGYKYRIAMQSFLC